MRTLLLGAQIGLLALIVGLFFLAREQGGWIPTWFAGGVLLGWFLMGAVYSTRHGGDPFSD